MRLSMVERLLRLVAGSAGRRAVAANSGWLLFDRAVRTLLGLLVGAWVARHLGPAQYGALAYVLAYVAMFQPFANLSADAIVVRRISQEPKSAPEVLGAALAMRIAFGFVCWFVAVGVAAIIGDDGSNLAALAAIVGGALLFQAADVVDLWFQTQTQSRRTVVAKLTVYVASSAAKVALIISDATFIAFAVVIALEGLFSAFAMVVAYRRCQTGRPWVSTRATAKAIVSECWPFMLSGFAIMVYMRIDQLMIREILGVEALGIYAAALPISQFWQVLPLVIATSIGPFLAKQRLVDEVAYRRSMVLAFRGFFYLGLLSAMATYAVSGWLVPRLFGSAYAPAILILDLHALSNIFCFLGIAHSLWLVNERQFAVRLYGTLLAGLASVGMNYYLLPRVGLPGACIAAIAAQAIAAFLINALLDRRSFLLQVEAVTFRKARL